MNLLAAVLLAVYFSALCVLALLSLHRLYLLWLLRRPKPHWQMTNDQRLAFVTVQLPVYNERFVISRTLDALSQLTYPRERIELQVLDDSTDETTELIAERLATLRHHGWTVSHLRRGRRDGYKAGALAAALPHARGEFILILDADFIPPPTLIDDLLGGFHSARVGMVQARWEHTNRTQNRLTRVQALLLDAHFLIETAARARARLFFNFHGTAALWRRTAIEDAGGWQADTLTEDLDLSYRAQLRGWTFEFLENVTVPGELPATLAAFKQQQARWAEGTIATARKHLAAILRSDFSGAIKAESCVHLLAHLVYPAALMVALLALPALLVRRTFDSTALTWLELGFLLAIVLPNRVFFRRAARLAGSQPPGWREIPLLMLTGVSLAVSNTRAVMRGLLRRVTPFERTPKTAGALSDRAHYAVRPLRSIRVFEGLLAAYLLAGVFIAAALGSSGAVPAFAFLAIGFGSTAVRS